MYFPIRSTAASRTAVEWSSKWISMALRTLLCDNQVRARRGWVGLPHHRKYARVTGHDLTQGTKSFGAHENRRSVQSYQHNVQDGEEQTLEALHTSNFLGETIYATCLLLGAGRRFSVSKLCSMEVHTLDQKHLQKIRSKHHRAQA